ncbi:carboxymuconolactone decarboxylase [Methylobacterium sp. J-072]|uniref:carboxymuconolactone decarboxylase family protein n=1 Tax=Methylobacterium sp. J-072 TaxID=2836651 RepID=UPI001FB8F14A|nr:carboxymuconolactone decarboxylase [Methylobacterium sp. J-072]MCJ2091491.1 carboxymuconolactone decarboxylase [Methylobacterium sp. J-072]
MKVLVLAAVSLLLAANDTSVQTVERFPPLQPDQMTAAQKSAADAILSGPRKSLDGPFNAWLRSPELSNRLQKVGEYLRFNTSLPRDLNEFAILITGRVWSSGYEWYAHHPLAIKAGLRPSIAEHLKAGRRPASMSTDEALIYDFSTQLHRDRQVSDALYKSVVARFGEQGAMDLIAVSGYYDLVCMTLNVAKVEPPADAKETLPSPPVPAD